VDVTDTSKSAATLALELRQEAARLTVVADILDAPHTNGASKKPRGRKAAAKRTPKASKVTAEQVLEWARQRGGEFAGGEVAAELGVKPTGIGPVLGAMTRRGELTARETDGPRMYSPMPL
jgi:hypothetical protein